MFAKTIVLSDAFLDMPMSARCLYFTLGMVADDDGFVNSPRSIMRQIGASDDDMKLLIAKKFVIIFDSGVIVIKHWRINNYLRNDRYKETNYTDEKRGLTVGENGTYHIANPGIPSNGIPNNGIPRLGKDSIDKVSIVQDSIGEVSKGECEGEPAPPEKKKYGKYVEMTFQDFSFLLREYGHKELAARIKSVDAEKNVGQDFAKLIRAAGNKGDG